ncbi:MAG: hypothetical protein AABW85_03780 [archaeon]
MATFSFEKAGRMKNYVVEKEATCMNCGNKFIAGKGIYARRFCSEACTETYMRGDR